jgi:hypothetical protein
MEIPPLPSLASLAAGDKFSTFIADKFGKPVAPAPSAQGSFSLLVAFGRCRHRLEESFVADVLCSLFGNPAGFFRVSLLEDRIFLFSVTCKEVGFEIYKIRKLSCVDFEISFHLFNDSGLASARSLSTDKPSFPWKEVGKKSSYAEMAKKPAKALPNVRRNMRGSSAMNQNSSSRILTGANQIPVARQFGGRQFYNSGSRKSVFDRLIFPRVSVFYRINWQEAQVHPLVSEFFREGWSLSEWFSAVSEFFRKGWNSSE